MLASRQQTITVSDGVATQGCWHHANKRQQSPMAWQHKDVGITPTNANCLWWRGNTRMLVSRQQTLTYCDGVATQGYRHHQQTLPVSDGVATQGYCNHANKRYRYFGVNSLKLTK